MVKWFGKMVAGGLAGVLALGVGHASAEYRFNAQELEIGTAAHPTVLAARLTQVKPGEIIVLNRAAEGQVSIDVYSLGAEGWVKSSHQTLNADIKWVDVLQLNGAETLVAFIGGELVAPDPESGATRTLLSEANSFSGPRKEEIPHLDVTRDLNGDGRDDIVIPGADGFTVYVQSEDGRFSIPPTVIPRKPNFDGILGADGYRYDLWNASRIFSIDYDQDRKSDLAYWNGDAFAVHLQAAGRFDDAPITFDTDVEFASDDLYSLASGTQQGRVLHSLQDLDGDGFADMAIASLTGGSVKKKQSAYEIHFGASNADQPLQFDKKPSRSFQSNDALIVDVEAADWDGDGDQDLKVTSIDKDFIGKTWWKEAKGAFGDDVLLWVELYEARGRQYSKKPNAEFRQPLDGVPSYREPGWVPLSVVVKGATHIDRNPTSRWSRSFNTMFTFADVNGDGIADIVSAEHPMYFNVNLGAANERLVYDDHQTVEVEPPNDGEFMFFTDLDGDGKQDIVMHRRYTQRDIHGKPTAALGEQPQQVVTVISK